MTNEEFLEAKIEKMAGAMIKALQLTSGLLLHRETGNWMEKEDVYTEMLQIITVLSTTLSETTVP